MLRYAASCYRSDVDSQLHTSIIRAGPHGPALIDSIVLKKSWLVVVENHIDNSCDIQHGHRTVAVHVSVVKDEGGRVFL